MSAIRQHFRRSDQTYVVLKPIRNHGVLMMPGEEFDKEDFKVFHLRSLHARRRIGVKGHAATDNALARYNQRAASADEIRAAAAAAEAERAAAEAKATAEAAKAETKEAKEAAAVAAKAAEEAAAVAAASAATAGADGA